MKVSTCQEVRYSDVTTSFQLRLGALFRYFQDAAIQHGSMCGDGARQARQSGFGWVMHRMGLEIDSYPVFEQKVQVSTWSRGGRGFKACRDFRLQIDGLTAARGTSSWVYVDFNAAQIRRIPLDLMEKYTTENEQATNMDLDQWKPAGDIEPDFKFSVTTRLQDFDSNGHMNNSVYADLLETALQRCQGKIPTVKELCLQFDRGIEPTVSEVVILMKRTADDQATFLMRDAGTIFCRGQCRFVP